MTKIFAPISFINYALEISEMEEVNILGFDNQYSRHTHICKKRKCLTLVNESQLHVLSMV
jgi:hypothetical protein